MILNLKTCSHFHIENISRKNCCGKTKAKKHDVFQENNL
jgi:hypothetical protein